MPRNPRKEMEMRITVLDEQVDKGLIKQNTCDAIKELVYSYDEESVLTSKPEGEDYRKANTLAGWTYRLMSFARETDLLTASLADIKMTLQAFLDGETQHVDNNDGITTSSLIPIVGALRVFYRYHDCGIDPMDIPMPKTKSTSVDEKDILTRDEIHELRGAAGNPRNKLLVDLLIYTGQRREALRTLRIKDIDLENKSYRYNPNAEGLKGAKKRAGRRPLLGAINSVRTWINDFHPTGEPDHYLITQQPSYHDVDPSRTVSRDMIRQALVRIKKKTSIEKPLNPHALRHCFVTICKRSYKMDNDTIKYLIGHSKDSTVMETTYAHLTGEDYSKAAEEAFGIREPKEESPLTPDFCNVCSEPMPTNDAKACPNCGTTYTPDAMSVKDQLDDAMFNDAKAASSDDDMEDLDILYDILKDHKEEIVNRYKQSQ